MSPYQKLQSKAEEIVSGISVLEGHLRITEETSNKILEIAKTTGAKRVCEIGFNAGHSALTWLTMCDDIEYFHSVDNCKHPYAAPQMIRMKQEFGDRFDYTIIDSTKLTPDFYRSYDLVVIDGGHYRAAVEHDYRTCKAANITWLLFDDCLHMTRNNGQFHRLTGAVTDLVRTILKSEKQPYRKFEEYVFQTSVSTEDPSYDRVDEIDTCSIALLLKRSKR